MFLLSTTLARIFAAWKGFLHWPVHHSGSSTSRCRDSCSRSRNRAVGKRLDMFFFFFFPVFPFDLKKKIGSGNHTWVEFHDGLDWHFTGAAEQDPGGHDRAWFVAEAAKATPNSIFAIWATSFEKRKSFFPLVWNPGSKAVFGDDVTHRYAKVGAKAEIKQFLTLEEAEIARKQIWEQRREKIKVFFFFFRPSLRGCFV